ncbi:unnamed protein product, partial [Meganyctiphanes norvegica]
AAVGGYGGGGHSTGGTGGYSQGGTDVGQYYYYYPVEEEGTTTTKPGKEGTDHPLYTPAIAIIVLLVMILLQLTLPGLIESIGPMLPTLVIDPITIPVPDNGRDLTDTSFLSWEMVNNLTTFVRSAIEPEECLPRLICYSAPYAAGGSKVLLSLLDSLPSEDYSSYVKVFKDSVLKKTDCNVYSCGGLGSKE